MAEFFNNEVLNFIPYQNISGFENQHQADLKIDASTPSQSFSYP
jgi:hypothetical protein